MKLQKCNGMRLFVYIFLIVFEIYLNLIKFVELSVAKKELHFKAKNFQLILKYIKTSTTRKASKTAILFFLFSLIFSGGCATGGHFQLFG